MAMAFHAGGNGGGGAALPRGGMRALTVQVVADRGGSWMAVRGELDLATAERLWYAIADALSGAGPGRLTLDLSGVGFIDARGIHVLLDAAHACARQGIALRILAAPAVRRVCTLADVSGELPID